MTLIMSAEERKDLFRACYDGLCINCALAPFCPGKVVNIDYVVVEEDEHDRVCAEEGR